MDTGKYYECFLEDKIEDSRKTLSLLLKVSTRLNSNICVLLQYSVKLKIIHCFLRKFILLKIQGTVLSYWSSFYFLIPKLHLPWPHAGVITSLSESLAYCKTPPPIDLYGLHILKINFSAHDPASTFSYLYSTSHGLLLPPSLYSQNLWLIVELHLLWTHIVSTFSIYSSQLLVQLLLA